MLQYFLLSVAQQLRKFFFFWLLKTGDHPAGNIRTHRWASFGKIFQRCQDLFPAAAFQQISHCSVLECRKDEFIIIIHAADDTLCIFVSLFYLQNQVRPVDARQFDIYNDDPFKFVCKGQCFFGRKKYPAYLEVLAFGNQVLQGFLVFLIIFYYGY